ncbi:MAG TPA: thiamine phosphate synthase [Methyloceanibacter sp.]|jgi:thiamine-phosphate pyrophosphorylase|nr:thiamine phosphate synthase [Methyloceanibacter sp.]
MAEVKPRCRLYLQLPAQPSAKLEAQLAQALASTDAACVLLCRDDAPTDESHAARLLDLIQGRGVACLIGTDARLAERLGADGLHIEADDEAYRKARDLLGESASIGAGCGQSRHDAMRLAELGADYVAFGPAAGSDIGGIDQYAELIAWWSEIFVVPCVAWNVDIPEDAARLAALGADFVAPSNRIWRDDSVVSLIAAIDSAIRHVRRAA